MTNHVSTRTILHLDLDAFFVAVERLDNPTLIGVPVIVGGRAEGTRGGRRRVLRRARKYGVHSAMPTAQALRFCPQVVLVSAIATAILRCRAR